MGPGMKYQPVAWAVMTDAAVAWRNTLRHGRRTMGGALAVAFGTVALILAAGFIEWIYVAMREDTIHAGLGHLQVMKKGYAEHGVADPYRYLLPADSADLKVLQGTPHVVSIAARLHFTGLVALGDATLSILGEGRDVEREVGAENALVIEAGAPLASDVEDGMVLGRGLADNLGAKVGDKVVILVTKRGGVLDGTEMKVRGIFSTPSKAYDDVALHLPFNAADRLMQAGGSHKWVVYLDGAQHTENAVRALQRHVSGDVAIVPWYDAADFYRKTVRLFSRQVLVMKLIIALVVVLTISNTMMMAVVERISEIATSMALGVRRVRILSRFLIEGLFIGLVGAIIGICAGYVLAEGISHVGIPMPPPPGMARGFLGRILVTPGLILDAFLLAGLTALAASAYPAWKASRMVIAEALRHGH